MREDAQNQRTCGVPRGALFPLRDTKEKVQVGGGERKWGHPGPHGCCDHESAFEEERVLSRLDVPSEAALRDGDGTAVLLAPNGPEPRCSGVRWVKAKCDFSQLLCGKGHASRPASRVPSRSMSEPAIRVLGGSAYAYERTCH